MDTYIIGPGAAVVTELLKLFPMLRRNVLVVAVLGIIVNTLALYQWGPNGLNWHDLVSTLMSSLTMYFAAIKPAMKHWGVVTQG